MSLFGYAKTIVLPKQRLTWFEKLPAHQRQEVLELVQGFLRGDLGDGWNTGLLAERVLAPNGIVINADTFRRFVREYEKNPDAFRPSAESAAEGCKGGDGSKVERRRQPKGTSKRKP